MNWLLLASGATILALTVVDLYLTVVKPASGGVLGTRAAQLIYSTGRAFHRRRDSHRLLANVGVVAVASVPLVWMCLMWLGWSLVYLSDDDAVMDPTTSQPADGWSRVYFGGYTLFTSGLGDRIPGTSGWQIATVLTSFMGLGLITLAITFLVPILQAATQRRSVARTITHLGETPAGIVDRSWQSHHRLSDLASDLASDISALTDKHLSYPVMEYLHSEDSCSAYGTRLAALHDATVIATGSADLRERADLDHLRTAISDFAAVLQSDRSFTLAVDPPPLPDHPDVDPATFERVAETRRQLDAMVRHDGWTSADVQKQHAGFVRARSLS